MICPHMYSLTVKRRQSHHLHNNETENVETRTLKRLIGAFIISTYDLKLKIVFVRKADFGLSVSDTLATRPTRPTVQKLQYLTNQE